MAKVKDCPECHGRLMLPWTNHVPDCVLRQDFDWIEKRPCTSECKTGAVWCPTCLKAGRITQEAVMAPPPRGEGEG